MFPQRRQETEALAQRLLGELSKLEKTGYGTASGEEVFSLLRRRIAATPIRAYFAMKLAEYSRSGQVGSRVLPLARSTMHFLHTQLPFITEVIISVQYLHNQILDGKADASRMPVMQQKLLAANLLKDHLYAYIDSEVPRRLREKTRYRVRLAFEHVDLGQHLEKTYNTYAVYAQAARMEPVALPAKVKEFIRLEGAQVFIDKIKKDLPRATWAYVDIYFERIYLTCAALFVHTTELIIEVLGIGQKRAAHLIQFASCYGLMRQLVNDNADLVPPQLALHTHGRYAEDAGSDLRNGTITLPLIFHLSEAPAGAIQHYLLKEGNSWEASQVTTYFTELIKNNGLYRSIQNCRILGELAVSYLDQKQVSAQLLADTCEIVHWNKFLYPCLRHPAYALYRVTAYSRQTKRLIRQLRHPHVVVANQRWASIRLTTPDSLFYARNLIRAYNPTA